jgi:NADH-quinone oxidoreductase subunit F
MDLRFHDTPPSPAERAAVDARLGPPDSGWAGGARHIGREGHVAHGGHAVRAQRHLLLPALHAVQDRVGWISAGALNYICQRLDIPPAEAYGVASFYALFALSPQPSVVVHVCDDIACVANGADALCAELERTCGPAGAPGDDGRATWRRSPCLGLCERAPAALLIAAGENPRAHVLASTQAIEVTAALSGKPALDPAPTRIPQAGDPTLRLLRRVGVVNPLSVDSYRSHGGYAALRRALELGPEGVIREVNDSKLLGRGGAAFPMGRKWDAVARAAVRPHYLVCNADESEPGTFKDRVLMEDDPFAVLEAMTIAGLRRRLRTWVSVHSWRVSARAETPGKCRRAGPNPGVAGRRRDGERISLRYRPPARRRGLYLR